MLNKKSKFALKLSRERIQLLLKNEEGLYLEIGSADPNNTKITKNLQFLRDQVQSLSGEYPLIDVMLPDELILVQNLTIESAEKPFSSLEAIELLSNACALEKEEINISLGSPTSHRTQPVAAVTAKTINETRYFLNNAGFNTNQFIASKPINGFAEAPVFIQDKAPKKSVINNRNATTIGSSIIAFLIAVLSLIFFFNPFNSSDFSNEVSTNISPTIIDKHLKSLDKRSNNILIPTNLTPIIVSTKILKSPEISLPGFLPKTISSKPLSGKANFKPKTFTDLYSNSDLESSKFLNKGSLDLNLIFNSENKYPSEIIGYLPVKANHSLILRQESKLQLLKSSIQHDYIQSIKPKFNQSEKIITVTETIRPAPPSKKIKKHLNKSETIVKPKLSLLEKIKLNFANVTFSKDTGMNIGITRDQTNESIIFRQTVSRLEMPKDSFKQKEFIKTLSGQNLMNFDATKFTPDDLLLSKKYKPIIRPDLVEKINVLIEPTLSSGAVTLSQNPIERPELIMSLDQLDPKDVNIIAKATKRPSFPRRASIINNATITNIIELNRTNLIGVFGTKKNAIALIRLSSGRIIKVRVGDKFAGWKVLTIYEDKIELANGGKQETLRLPG